VAPFTLVVDVNHHFPSPLIDAKVEEILKRVIALQTQEGRIMSKLDELEAELIIANTTTTEIAADIDDLLAKLATPGLTAAEADKVKADIQGLAAQLRTVADKHNPTP
jgi:5'-deoxynucleotidase YfbR-like HD superfamily hydrolase